MSWPIVQLGEIAEIERKSISPADIPSGARYVGLEHIESGGASLSFGNVENGELASNKFLFNTEHILFGKLRPYLAKIVCPEFSGICSTDILPIAPKKRVDKRYLLHFLRRPETIGWASARATGVNLPRLSPSELETLSLPLPPLDEQRRIAAILDKADALRRKRRRAIELLDQLRVQLIEIAFETVDSFATIGDVCDVQGGLQLSRSRSVLPIEVPYLRVANVYRNRLELGEIKSMRVTQAEMERTLLKPNDILFVEGHGNANEIGRCAVWDGSIDPCIHQNHLIRARVSRPDLDAEVLSHWLNSTKGRRYLLNRGKTTSGLNTISVSDVRATTVPHLHPDQQKQLKVKLNTIKQQKIDNEKQLLLLNAVFSALQHRAFAGQL